MSMEMSSDYALGLATGYAWGHTDQGSNSVAGTLDGITFGVVYKRHVEREARGEISVRYSIQRAYDAWLAGEQLP